MKVLFRILTPDGTQKPVGEFREVGGRVEFFMDGSAEPLDDYDYMMQFGGSDDEGSFLYSGSEFKRDDPVAYMWALQYRFSGQTQAEVVEAIPEIQFKKEEAVLDVPSLRIGGIEINRLQFEPVPYTTDVAVGFYDAVSDRDHLVVGEIIQNTDKLFAIKTDEGVEWRFE